MSTAILIYFGPVKRRWTNPGLFREQVLAGHLFQQGYRCRSGLVGTLLFVNWALPVNVVYVASVCAEAIARAGHVRTGSPNITAVSLCFLS